MEGGGGREGVCVGGGGFSVCVSVDMIDMNLYTTPLGIHVCRLFCPLDRSLLS